MNEFLKPLNSFSSNDANVDLGHVEGLFNMLMGNMLDANWSLRTLRGYNPSLDHLPI